MGVEILYDIVHSLIDVKTNYVYLILIKIRYYSL